ncbi:MAG TPA: hypothetical protein VHY79_04160 [Rhizomicrobium sp.]|jgi:glutathione S-transferase|nr:hypothetical protein [Rhizomicrobium sp.]
MQVAILGLFHTDKEWVELARPSAEQLAQPRLSGLSASLGDKPYLDGDAFTAADLMMTTVLRILPGLFASDTRLETYVERCSNRPAFKGALDAQLADFQEAE